MHKYIQTHLFARYELKFRIEMALANKYRLSCTLNSQIWLKYFTSFFKDFVYFIFRV